MEGDLRWQYTVTTLPDRMPESSEEVDLALNSLSRIQASH